MKSCLKKKKKKQTKSTMLHNNILYSLHVKEQREQSDLDISENICHIKFGSECDLELDVALVQQRVHP